MPKRVFRNPDEYTTYELAEFLGVKRETLLSWLRRGLIPEPNRRGNKRIWSDEQACAIKKMVIPKE